MVSFLISACDAVNTALLIVDVQNCFLPGSILAVADGEKVIPVINDIRDKYSDKMAVTVLTQVYMEPMERIFKILLTVERQWLEHLWNHDNMFETGVVRANEC